MVHPKRDEKAAKYTDARPGSCDDSAALGLLVRVSVSVNYLLANRTLRTND
ncbi:MAG: hypothetical protein U1E63_06935 [Burkholderiales bacterium]